MLKNQAMYLTEPNPLLAGAKSGPAILNDAFEAEAYYLEFIRFVDRGKTAVKKVADEVDCFDLWAKAHVHHDAFNHEFGDAKRHHKHLPSDASDYTSRISQLKPKAEEKLVLVRKANNEADAIITVRVKEQEQDRGRKKT
jgi:hypothetical protein